MIDGPERLFATILLQVWRDAGIPGDDFETLGREFFVPLFRVAAEKVPGFEGASVDFDAVYDAVVAMSAH